MSFKILTKKSVEHSNIDGARQNYFMSGMRDGIVKGSLNEGELFASASNVIALDSCVLLIGGHEVIIDAAEYITINDYPTTNTRMSLVAEIVVSSDGDPSFRIYTQSASTELIQDNLYDSLVGDGTYQLEIGKFIITTTGQVENVERTINLISGGSDVIGIDIVTAETLAPSENAEVTVTLKKKDKNKNYLDFDFKIPQGKTGATGPIGPQGPKGDSGLADGATLSNTAGTSDVNGYTQQGVNNLVSNPNLLINGDFRVNQRGQTSYTAQVSTTKYNCLDKWFLNWGTSLTSINENSISLQFIRQYAIFGQSLKDVAKYKGKTFTLSAKLLNISTTSGLFLRISDGVQNVSTSISSDGFYTRTITVDENATELLCTIFNTNTTGTTVTLDVEYMKLEIGSVATAYSPKPYEEELADCQVIEGGIATTYSNPNLLINGDFKVNQRGVTLVSTNRTYGADRFEVFKDNSVSDSYVDFSTKTLSVGVERSYCIMGQVTEIDLSLLSGKTITFSADLSNQDEYSLFMQMGYITSGSSSYQSLISTTVSTKIESKRFSITAQVPSGLSAGSYLTARIYKNVGSCTFDNFKVEIGSVATPFSPRPYAEELAMCQRYYQKIGLLAEKVQYCSADSSLYQIRLATPMRTAPTLPEKSVYYDTTASGVRTAFNNTSLTTISGVQVTGINYTTDVSDLRFSITHTTSITPQLTTLLMQKVILDAEIY